MSCEAINNSALYEEQPELSVHVSFDETARRLTMRDNGIGMSRQEAIDHLGTIAKSGTKELMGRFTGDQKAGAQLIGQFRVGFYSSFIVADKISVESRRAGLPADQGVRWTNTDIGDFAVEDLPRAERGTSVILHLRQNAGGEWEAVNKAGALRGAGDSTRCTAPRPASAHAKRRALPGSAPHSSDRWNLTITTCRLSRRI